MGVKYKKGFYEQKMSLRSSNSSIKRKINFRSQSMKLTKSPPPTQFDADIFIYEVTTYDKTCLNYIKVLEAAEAASKKMTTHAEADAEVAALKERYKKVKTVSEEWVKKVDTLMKEWVLLDNTVTELNSWVAKTRLP